MYELYIVLMIVCVCRLACGDFGGCNYVYRTDCYHRCHCRMYRNLTKTV